MSLQEAFIRNLKKIRKNAGFSQLTLSVGCDASASYIGEIEIGRKFPSVKMIEKIADALKVPPHLLFWDEQNIYNNIELPPAIPAGIKETIIGQLTGTIEKVIKQY